MHYGIAFHRTNHRHCLACIVFVICAVGAKRQDFVPARVPLQILQLSSIRNNFYMIRVII